MVWDHSKRKILKLSKVGDLILSACPFATGAGAMNTIGSDSMKKPSSKLTKLLNGVVNTEFISISIFTGLPATA